MENIQKQIIDIVSEAKELKDKHTAEKIAVVNYACIFSQNREEHEELLSAAKSIGKIIQETPTGPLFHIRALSTAAGPLKLLKVRLPDPSRPEKGDADFTVSDFSHFKEKCLSLPGFSLIQRETCEMIELKDPAFNIRAYFSNPPLDQELKIS